MRGRRTSVLSWGMGHGAPLDTLAGYIVILRRGLSIKRPDTVCAASSALAIYWCA